MKKRVKTIKGFAISGIFLIVMSLFAFSFVLSESVVVSGAVDCWKTNGQKVSVPSGSCFDKGYQSVKPVTANSRPSNPPSQGSLINPAGLAPDWFLRLIGNVDAEGNVIPLTGKTAVGGMINGAAHAGMVVGVIQFVGPFLGLEEDTTNALSMAAGLGIFTGETVYGLIQGGSLEGLLSAEVTAWLSNNAVLLGWGTGIAVAAIAFLLLYSEDEKKIVKFTCLVDDFRSWCNIVHNDHVHPD